MQWMKELHGPTANECVLNLVPVQLVALSIFLFFTGFPSSAGRLQAIPYSSPEAGCAHCAGMWSIIIG